MKQKNRKRGKRNSERKINDLRKKTVRKKKDRKDLKKTKEFEDKWIGTLFWKMVKYWRTKRHDEDRTNVLIQSDTKSARVEQKNGNENKNEKRERISETLKSEQTNKQKG